MKDFTKKLELFFKRKSNIYEQEKDLTYIQNFILDKCNFYVSNNEIFSFWRWQSKLRNSDHLDPKNMDIVYCLENYVWWHNLNKMVRFSGNFKPLNEALNMIAGKQWYTNKGLWSDLGWYCCNICPESFHGNDYRSGRMHDGALAVGSDSEVFNGVVKHHGLLHIKDKKLTMFL